MGSCNSAATPTGPPLIRIPGVLPKIWVPSLYLGGLTFVLALPAVRASKGPPWRVWLSVIIVVSIVGGLGEYTSPHLADPRRSPPRRNRPRSRMPRPELGPVDKFDSERPIREDGFLRDGDGSVYWLLATFLPGFRQFRFPAKLFTFTALGLAALAGLGWDRVCSRTHARRERSSRRFCSALPLATLVGRLDRSGSRFCATLRGNRIELDVRPARCRRRVPGDHPMPGARRSRTRWDCC